ncbi:hypothetical protein HMPREF9446_03315 [Bacteroides fluxus YIT 12057]|uniref:Uncharacterized protein n=1 Tax=Bacteroides fluxus YIT 12057 TaxID=763034 RepID=F3PX27_9BACE|nr:hypothetical protein HMPREF9446_03315 [Bacteroides fluxus YIT 12057]
MFLKSVTKIGILCHLLMKILLKIRSRRTALLPPALYFNQSGNMISGIIYSPE